MKRTISISMGKGSVNHNTRKFKAANVDGERSCKNISYCNESIKKVYHELFDEALKKFNERQTRADRRIDNYYEKIRNSKQEKPFYEAVVQIGNKEDMSAIGDNAELSKQIMDEYFSGFKERNPHLRVFSAHLHLDEATPHLHIDFVPFTTGSKRGLETRVSLKQALTAQGFKGGSRGDTEWNQWVQAEKEMLARVMVRYGIEWEQKGTHNEHLSVLDYKKQERVKEIEQLESKLADKKDEFKSVENRIRNYDKGTQVIAELEQRIETDSEYQLPEPQGLMSAKTYKQKFVEPLIKKLKAVIKEVFFRYYNALDNYHRLNATNGNLYRENERLTKRNEILLGKNENLRAEVKDYKLLRKVFGSKQIDSLIEQAKSKQRETRFRNNKNER
ncbi:MAG: plasmid recombination protein [Clostridia bacterium]|nr:plasmid recombination protein [Clostridia bacterium]